MSKRTQLSRKKSNNSFKRGLNTKTKNISPAPSRGGYRL